uniref:Uncharacterized protein n=1 Tax=Engystomops pustulosus TaxID=76066 RepID=A0AAV6Z3V1_ENGPU|nr:hypothetical protein GDO81_027711 [Engystomops pustulosus]
MANLWHWCQRWHSEPFLWALRPSPEMTPGNSQNVGTQDPGEELASYDLYLPRQEIPLSLVGPQCDCHIPLILCGLGGLEQAQCTPRQFSAVHR